MGGGSNDRDEEVVYSRVKPRVGARTKNREDVMEGRKTDQLSKLSEFEVDVIQVQPPKTDSCSQNFGSLTCHSQNNA